MHRGCTFLSNLFSNNIWIQCSIIMEKSISKAQHSYFFTLITSHNLNKLLRVPFLKSVRRMPWRSKKVMAFIFFIDFYTFAFLGENSFSFIPFRWFPLALTSYYITITVTSSDHTIASSVTITVKKILPSAL